MSHITSQGRREGQRLSEDGRELVGRSVDVNWDRYRPHAAEVIEPPERVPALIERTVGEEVPSEPWVAWSPCDDESCTYDQVPPPTEGLLDDFLALEGGTPDDVARFVVKRGSLGFCVHLRPHHCPEMLSGLILGTGRGYLYWDPPEAYRGYARIFRYCLAIAADLQAGQPPNQLHLAHVTRAVLDDVPSPLSPPVLPEELSSFGKSSLSDGTLVRTLDALMLESPISLGFEMGPDERGGDQRPRIRLFGSTFGVATYQLAIAIQGGLFAICSHCHQTYAPTRRPQQGRDNYCSVCREERKSAYRRRRQASTGARP